MKEATIVDGGKAALISTYTAIVIVEGSVCST